MKIKKNKASVHYFIYRVLSERKWGKPGYIFPSKENVKPDKSLNVYLVRGFHYNQFLSIEVRIIRPILCLALTNYNY